MAATCIRSAVWYAVYACDDFADLLSEDRQFGRRLCRYTKEEFVAVEPTLRAAFGRDFARGAREAGKSLVRLMAILSQSPDCPPGLLGRLRLLRGNVCGDHGGVSPDHAAFLKKWPAVRQDLQAMRS